MVEVNSRDIERQDIEVKELTDRVNDHAVMLGRIDENLKYLREYIEQK
jgi:hypothetical protein